jgi:23S rRNA (guanosine2251-2'-O)-methyltransferase
MDGLMNKIVIVLDDVRSCHNVGSIIRTAEGLGVSEIYYVGITPHPITQSDQRLPHQIKNIEKQIFKTSLGAEKQITHHYISNIQDCLMLLTNQKFEVWALEIANAAEALPNITEFPAKLALIVGNEVAGIHPKTLALCQKIVMLPMFGQKESYNVSVAAAMAISQIKYKNIT